MCVRLSESENLPHPQYCKAGHWGGGGSVCLRNLLSYRKEGMKIPVSGYQDLKLRLYVDVQKPSGKGELHKYQF